MKLTFLGCAGTVTGSRYLLSDDKHRLLVDCGMYQGVKNLLKRNWAPFLAEPSSINAVVLTHAHIDHTRYLPALVKNGFKGKIYCTKATHELCKVLLPDAVHLQEEDAKYAFRKGFSKHNKPEQLFAVKKGSTPGTRGNALVNGAESVKIHGKYWPVKAEVYNLDSLSAHGGYRETLQWLKAGTLKPEKVYIAHGEIVASDMMRERVRERFGWGVEVAELFEGVEV